LEKESQDQGGQLLAALQAVVSRSGDSSPTATLLTKILGETAKALATKETAEETPDRDPFQELVLGTGFKPSSPEGSQPEAKLPGSQVSSPSIISPKTRYLHNIVIGSTKTFWSKSNNFFS
jgi:hypothetical protein